MLPRPVEAGALTITPSGFLESIATFRTTSAQDGISTRFGSIPLASERGEYLMSLRHSRASVEAEASLGTATLTGYVETDFLNRPPSQPYRFRQYFGALAIGDWEFSAGQEWSLLRSNRVGLESEGNLMNTHAVDPGYHLGVIGRRVRQVRVVRRLGDWHVATALEGRDVLAKVTHDGERLHWEVAGVAGRERRRGLSLACVLRLTPQISLVAQEFWSRGGGSDTLGVVPQGVTAWSTLEGIEARVAPGTDIFAYGGLIYGARSEGNRLARQWSAGVSQRIARNALGTLSVAAQISQLDRAIWSGARGSQTFGMIGLRQTFGTLP